MKKLTITCLILFFSFLAFSQKSYENPIALNLKNLDLDNFKKVVIDKNKFDDTVSVTARVNSNTILYAKIVLSEKAALLGIWLNYNADKWLFMKKAIIKIGNQKFDFDLEKTKRTVVSGNYVNESCLIIPSEEFYRAILNADPKETDITIRFSGDYIRDKPVSRSYIKKLQYVLNAYELLLDSSQ